jgi:putative ABC transport system permease protein
MAVSIARSAMRREPRRYLAAVLSVTFAGLLMLVQVALLQGLFASVSAPLDRSSSPLWIGFPAAPSVDLGRTVSVHAAAAARIHPAVQRVEAFNTTGGDLRRADGVAMGVFVYAVDTDRDALIFDRLLTPAQRALLEEPDALLIDTADLGKLDAQIGSQVEINGKRAVIRGTVDGLRGIGGLTVLASWPTAQRFDPQLRRDEPHFWLLRLAPGADASAVAARLADASPHPRWQVYGAQDFSLASQAYWLFESGVGLGAGFGVLLALIVGTVITSQTLAAAINASLKEFAALRALGVSRRQLGRVVLELALWIGAIGLVLTALFSGLLFLLARSQHVAMVLAPWSAAATALLVMAITSLSGWLALRPLYRAEPADLLR